MMIKLFTKMPTTPSRCEEERIKFFLLPALCPHSVDRVLVQHKKGGSLRNHTHAYSQPNTLPKLLQKRKAQTSFSKTFASVVIISKPNNVLFLPVTRTKVGKESGGGWRRRGSIVAERKNRK
jgi:hypothetical protein